LLSFRVSHLADPHILEHVAVADVLKEQNGTPAMRSAALALGAIVAPTDSRDLALLRRNFSSE
jgi:hypothetical protein